MKKSSSTITKCCHKLKNLADVLADCDSKIDEMELVIQLILQQLPHSYHILFNVPITQGTSGQFHAYFGAFSIFRTPITQQYGLFVPPPSTYALGSRSPAVIAPPQPSPIIVSSLQKPLNIIHTAYVTGNLLD